MSMTYGFFIRANAEKHPDRPALIWEDEVFTYRDLHTRSNQLANALGRLGIRKGDKVSLYMTNCVEYIEAIFALAKIGAVFVPIGYRLVAKEMKFIVDHSESVALIFTGDLADQVQEVRRELAGVSRGRCILVGSPRDADLVSYETLLQSGDPSDPDVEVNEEDEFYIAYTSGTTGFPKGAVFTQRARMIALLQMAIEFGIDSRDITLTSGPLYHAAPCFISLLHLFLGTQVVLMKQFDPVEQLRNIQKYKITNVFMVPTMYNMILNLPEEEKRAYEVSSVRVLLSAAAPLPTKTKESILEFFPQGGLFEFYGFTEVGLATVLRPEDQLRKTRCVGLPTYFLDLRILDGNGKEVPQGKEGLIYVKCSYLMKEYFKNPKATQAAFHGNWLTAQDIGTVDEEGYLYVVDRKADMVISGGVNIYPVEIDDVLQRHPKVLEAAVIGVPDAKWGETLLAFIVPRPGMEVTADEIMEFCEGKLAKFKVPRAINLVAELPKSPAGKVLKRILREPYWKGQEARV